MAKSAVIKDMTYGNETKLLLQFMMPMLVGNIFQQVYNLADSIIVGRSVGSDALGAVGCTASITFLFFALCQGLASGAGVIVSQYFGAGEHENVKRTIANSFYIVMLSGILLSILGVVLAEPVLVLLDTPKVQLKDAVDYMQIVCAGTIAVAAYNYVAQIMRALGDAKTPLIFLLIATGINIVLDIVFVVYMEMGVKGAGYATIIAQALSAVGCFVVGFMRNPFFKLNIEHIRIDLEISKLCFKVGMPLAVQSMTIAISCVVLQKFVNGFDKDVVSAFTVTSRIEQFVQQPYSSLAVAISTFTGQNMGAGKTDRVRRALVKGIWITAIISAIMLVLSFVAGEVIVGCFVKDSANVITIGTKGLHIISTMFFPLGIIYVTRGVLNGANDTFYAMINGVIEVCCRVGFSVLLVYVFPIGIWSVWFATGFTWVVTGVSALLRYKQGIWLKRVIVKSCHS